MACGTLFPDQELNPGPLHWEQRFLATGPPGKSQVFDLLELTLTYITLDHAASFGYQMSWDIGLDLDSGLGSGMFHGLENELDHGGA